jgi:transposase
MEHLFDLDQFRFAISRNPRQRPTLNYVGCDRCDIRKQLAGVVVASPSAAPLSSRFDQLVWLAMRARRLQTAPRSTPAIPPGAGPRPIAREVRPALWKARTDVWTRKFGSSSCTRWIASLAATGFPSIAFDAAATKAATKFFGCSSKAVFAMDEAASSRPAAKWATPMVANIPGRCGSTGLREELTANAQS